MATNSQDKKVLVDLVNKIRYEVTDEQLAELAGNAASSADNEFIDWHARINRLDLRGAGRWLGGQGVAQLRTFLHRVLNVTRQVGGKAIAIGKRIIRWLFSVIACYPSTLAAAVVMAALAVLLAQVPLLGVLLLPLAKLMGAAFVLYVFLKENIQMASVNLAVNR